MPNGSFRRAFSCVLIGAAAVAASTGCGLVQVRTNVSTSSPQATRAPVSPEPSAATPAPTVAAAEPAAEVVHKPVYNTVVDRFPGTTQSDALDLAKARHVIETAAPDMFYTATDEAEPAEALYVAMFAEPDNVDPDPDSVSDEPGVGTAAKPYATTWTKGELRLQQRNVLAGRLAPGTPVLVWNLVIDDVSKQPYAALVVTLDGGRYFTRHVPVPVTPGLRTGSLPPPVQHDVLTGKEIRKLEALGQFPAGTAKKIADARVSASACSERIWKKKFAARDAAISHANVSDLAQASRHGALRWQWEETYPVSCAAQKKQFDAALFSAIELRKKNRIALYNDVVANKQKLAQK